MATVYLIHFDRPYVSPGGKRPQHYLGATSLGLRQRIERHSSSKGAALLRAVNAAGIAWRVVRTWPVASKREAFQLEIQLKRRRRHARLCPLCLGQGKQGGQDGGAN